ncbi:cytoplasmic dynein 2 intermediate chain 2-like [Haliotis asinina]|uniref:cytoplasmic dynein 2 intermediate chain 2-like n=1 Tax=Haliotis asinina TaxID=109174 RepID=UPI00353231D6
MFTDENLDPVEFKSSWKKERHVSDNSCQTSDLLIEEVGCQSIERNDEGTQTDDGRDRALRLAETDSQRLHQFLQRVEPLIVAALSKNLKSHAFDNLLTSSENEGAAVTCVHTLGHAELSEELQVTGLSWNCTGSVIAGTYGRYDHEDWCTHKAAVATWNLDKRSLNVNKPDTVIDSSSCIMCLEFHPENPAWIAGGNFNGEVMVWDLSKEDDLLIATSGIGDDAHREPVTKVKWIPDPASKSRRHQIISASGDGKILIWAMSSKKQKLKLVDGFVLMAQSLPRSMKTRSVRADKEIGVTCLSYNAEDKDMFIIGSESGCVFKCSMHAQGNPAGSHVISSVPLRSPVTFTFNPHHGPVYSVDCSPHHRHAFLSSGMDQCLRLYNMLQDQPILTIEPGDGYLYGAKWSPVRPTVLATVSENGSLLVYDLREGNLAPLQKLEAGMKKTSVYSLQFNAHQRHLLATGDGLGYIKIWKLGDELTTQLPRENDQLSNLISTSAD